MLTNGRWKAWRVMTRPFFNYLFEQPAAERATDRYLELFQDQSRSPFELALSENLKRLND